MVYLRKVNANRVNLFTELQFEDNYSKSKMTAAAEYTLKQSKVHFSVDSDLLIKSMVEATVAPGCALQLCAEIQHSSEAYRFGYGLVFS